MNTPFYMFSAFISVGLALVLHGLVCTVYQNTSAVQYSFSEDRLHSILRLNSLVLSYYPVFKMSMWLCTKDGDWTNVYSTPVIGKIFGLFEKFATAFPKLFILYVNFYWVYALIIIIPMLILMFKGKISSSKYQNLFFATMPIPLVVIIIVGIFC